MLTAVAVALGQPSPHPTKRCLAADESFDLDYISISDQDMMELVIADLSEESKRLFQNSKGGYRYACDWTTESDENEYCEISCDEAGRVTGFVHKVRAGMYNLRALPLRIRVFRILHGIETIEWRGIAPKQNVNVTGTLDTSALPLTLQVFDISENAFEGQVDFEWLPQGLNDFMISRNNFLGSCNLKSLPKALLRCFLERNAFTGSISLDSLPLGLTHLRLHENNFQGTLNFNNLPDSLRHLNVGGNGFTGSFLLDKRSAPIILLARDVQMSGTAIIVDNDDVRVDLKCEHISVVHDENGSTHENTELILDDESREMLFPRHLDRHEYEYRDLFPFDRFTKSTQMSDDKLLQLCIPGAPSDGVKRDLENRIVEISYFGGGTIFLDFIPPLVEDFNIPSFKPGRSSETYGTLNTSRLSESLKDFIILQNEFTGPVDMTKLPRGLCHQCNIGFNQFYGKCDSTLLAPKLKYCYLHVNNFSGGIDLSRLPESLAYLSINDNCFTGYLNIEDAHVNFFGENNLFDCELTDLSGIENRDEYPPMVRDKLYDPCYEEYYF